MLFSGPLQPPLLGAALASARLHLEPEFPRLQEELLERIDHTISFGQARGVRFATLDRTPIFFVRCGPSSAAFTVAKALREQGLYTCISVFPAVPQNQAGIRFTLSLHNTKADIEQLLDVLGKEMALAGVTGRSPASSIRRMAEISPGE